MSEATCIEEDVLAFLYRIRLKEKNTPQMQNGALVLSNRIVESCNAHDGFGSYKKLRDQAKGKNARLLAHLNDALAGLEKLKVAHAQWKFDTNRLIEERKISALARKKIAQMARESKQMEKTISDLRKRLEPKKRTVAKGRKLAV